MQWLSPVFILRGGFKRFLFVVLVVNSSVQLLERLLIVLVF